MWDVPAWRAAGWFKTSAPAGQPGNTVLTGHSNIYGSVFSNLSALRAGDYIELNMGGVRRWYVVSDRHILQEDGQPLDVRRANARWFMPTEDERLTLITCAPGGARLIVVALPTGQPPQIVKVSVTRSEPPAHRRAPPRRR
jgi:LPXTG-site transpeptidase (sortase) family protein